MNILTTAQPFLILILLDSFSSLRLFKDDSEFLQNYPQTHHRSDMKAKQIIILFCFSCGNGRRASSMQRQTDPRPSQSPEHGGCSYADDCVEPSTGRAAQPHVDHGQSVQVHELRYSQRASRRLLHTSGKWRYFLFL